MATPREYDPRYLAGIDRFNAEDYFEAHEIWEHRWRDCPQSERRFYQSLIQAAVALYHHYRGNRSGAVRLARSGRAKMSEYGNDYLGLDTSRFWEAIDKVIRPDETTGGEQSVPSPRIVLNLTI